MKSLDTRRYEMLVRVPDFGSANPHLFPASELSGKAFVAVGLRHARFGRIRHR